MGQFRFLLAISVFLTHVISPGTFLSNIGFGGANSVEIFFVISGFYIALILDKKYLKIRVFYINRALRIYPTYFAICGVVLIVCLFSSTIRKDMFSYPGIALAVATVSNLTLFGIDGVMFLQWNGNSLDIGNFNFSDLPLWHMLWVPQAWSLGVEVVFYMCAPFLCKLKSRHLVTLVSLLISLRIFSWTHIGLNEDPWSYRFFPFELPLFLIGVLLYRLRAHGKIRFLLNAKFLNTITVVIFLVFGFTVQIFKSNQLTTMSFLIALVSVNLVLNRSNSQLDRWFASMAYPVYLSHGILFRLYREFVNFAVNRNTFFDLLNNQWVSLFINLGAVLIVSGLLLKFQKPFDEKRNSNLKTQTK
jgi:peptidoglycan/LPS O-acetylase OafA/YrhL